MDGKQHGRAKHTDEPCHAARERIDEDDGLKNVKACALCRTLVTADRIDTTPEHGALENEPTDEDEQDHEDDADGHI